MGNIKHNKIFKFLSVFVAFVFLFEQIAFSADRIGYRYDYSYAKSLLDERTELDQAGRMSPAYLQNAQRKHEEIIRSKNIVEENLVYFLDNRFRNEALDESVPLKQRVSPDLGKLIRYALSDFDDEGQAQQISVYSYRGNSRSLEKVISYDIRDIDREQWRRGRLEEISEKDEEKVLGSFFIEEYDDLIDELKLREVVYSVVDKKDQIDYILSDFRMGKATEVSLYNYNENKKTLKDVKTYDVSLLSEKYSNADWQEYMEQENQKWEEEVKANGRLTKEFAHETKDGEDRVVYALSENDADGIFGKLDCYDYDDNDAKELTAVRTYNIKGVNWKDNLSDFRNNNGTYNDFLISETIYTGEKDKEIIDHVLSVYSGNVGDEAYKPLERSNYVRSDEGRLMKIETYRTTGGMDVLQRVTEFMGLKGHEIIERSYDYKPDGLTIGGVNIYEYEADGNKYTLDKMTRYVGAVDTRDLTGAEIKSETYYAGPENREHITRSFGFNTLAGEITSETKYVYEDKDLREVNTYRKNEMESTLASRMMYKGVEGQEKVERAMSYDLAGGVLSETLYDYNSHGALQMTLTSELSGTVISRTIYEGAENLEKRSITKSYDLAGNELTYTFFEYDDMDILTKSTTIDAENTKIFETMYDNMKNSGKAVLTKNFDMTGPVISFTEYEYDSSGILKKTVNKTDEGMKISETLYEGAEDYEAANETQSFDLAEELLTLTKYEYEETGALTKTVTSDTNDKKLSETTYAGRMNREKVTLTQSFDSAEELLTLTKYEYETTGALTKTVTSDTNDKKLSETTYAGRMNREKVTLTQSFDLTEQLLTSTKYEYEETGALTKTVTSDTNDKKLSETTYAGRMNREKVTLTQSFDLTEELLTSTKYEYEETGALTKTVTCDTNDKKLSETTYTGRINREKVTLTQSFDLAEELLTLTKYEYEETGALTKTVTCDTN
ncbi:MAG: hypothetical protein ABH844_05580, partial [Candidatus Omnitrophota bacterium]